MIGIAVRTTRDRAFPHLCGAKFQTGKGDFTIAETADLGLPSSIEDSLFFFSPVVLLFTYSLCPHQVAQ